AADHARELDPQQMRAFMAEHAKPGDQSGSQLEWAVRVLRLRGGETSEGLSVEGVVSEFVAATGSAPTPHAGAGSPVAAALRSAARSAVGRDERSQRALRAGGNDEERVELSDRAKVAIRYASHRPAEPH